MRRALPLAAAALAIAACSERAHAPTAPETATARVAGPTLQVQESAFVPGRVLVRFAPGADASRLAAGAGAEVARILEVGVHVLNVPAGAEAAVIQGLSRNAGVEFAEPDWIRIFGDLGGMPVNDPFIGFKWDLDNDGRIYNSSGTSVATTGAVDADMDWREAYEYLSGTVTGSARIGIMDTGIRHDHEEIQGRIAAEYDFFGNDGDAADDHGHGTHVAGIAAGAADNDVGIAGVAFGENVDFVITKVCGQSGGRGPFASYGCPSSAIADGIVFAVDNGADVLNLSLGGSVGSTTTRSALQYARANGVLPICAAGNEAGPVSYPGAWPECVAVSATDWSDDLASYSNYGSEVELSAPGGDDEDASGYSYIASSYYDGPSSYVLMAGTSMASPQVAGLAALLHALGITGADAKLTRMKDSADDLGTNGADPLFGAGRVNVFAAVNGLAGGGGGGGTPNTPPTSVMTFDCTYLACEFDGTGSTDTDGTVVGYSWDFGAGGTAAGPTANHTFPAAGTHSVSLTVTDDDGDSHTTSTDVTVEEAPASGGIQLDFVAGKEKGRHMVTLTWTGATSEQVRILRDGDLYDTVPNTGSYTDRTNQRGGVTYTYRVCEDDLSTCSNVVTVVY
ncbi:MAG: S8 family serine peptidase [Gemmatimonadales bacterium]|nr:MAG: S8 family serine peptidase [Gemmatimonadales bacterium]